MTEDKLRQNVHRYIDQLDEPVLRMIHAMLKEYTSVIPLSEENEAELRKRRKEYKLGKGKSYSVAETKVELRRRISKK